jgi:hypothetical protein
MAKSKLTFQIREDYHEAVYGFPFEENLESWHARNVSIYQTRRGNSRHPVLFARGLHHAHHLTFAIKETTPELAEKEISNYDKLHELNISTLTPVGMVVREDEPLPVETPVGTMYEKNETAFLITRLEDAALPESFLFSLGFQPKAKREIFNAIADLFAECHAKNVYWGDGSLDNVLIKFTREDYTLGKRRKLIALLSDAETVEIHPTLTSRMKESDMDFFFESMLWTDEEFFKRGIARDKTITSADMLYIRERYANQSLIWKAHKIFDTKTGFNSVRHFGKVRNIAHLDTLLRHIEEHKWYMNERGRREVKMREATIDWYAFFFLPIQELLKQNRFAEVFPDKTELEVYVEIMENKYYLSQQQKTDVGLHYAIQDYGKRFGVERGFMSTLSDIFSSLIELTKQYTGISK